MIKVWRNATGRARYSHFVISLTVLSLFSLSLWKTSQAQVPTPSQPITSSGLNTQVNLSTTSPAGTMQYNITGGTRAGTNLFHSFGDFNVPAHNIANFLNDSGLETSNILGRVTGGNASSIFGTIQTTGFGNANLFLMNPSGIVFGPTATLHVGGSVAFTTAGYLRFSDNGRFNAIPNVTADALLSTSPVAAYGFLGSNLGAITAQGSTLKVSEGQGISLVGGDITVRSGRLESGTVQPTHLSASGGQIHIASLASPGEILAETLDQAHNIKGESFGTLGTIKVSEGSVIDVSGNGGGTVLIRGGQFVLESSKISANVTGPGKVANGAELIGDGIAIVSRDAMIKNGASLETNLAGKTTPGVQYGGVHVKADRIEIAGAQDSMNATFSHIKSTVLPGSTGGNSGNVTLEAHSILMRDLVLIDASVGEIGGVQRGIGNAGNISIATSHNLEVYRTLITSISGGGSTGNAGNIELMSASGNIVIAHQSQVTSQVNSSNGNTGNIMLSAAHGDIQVADQASVFNQTFGGGTIGSIQVTANNLQLNGGASISGDNLSLMTPGNIDLNLSGSLSLTDASFIQTVARMQTPAAGLTIRARDITITDGSFLSTESKSSGIGGPLNIFTDNLQLIRGGQIRSGSTFGQDPNTGTPITPTGPGGIITIQGQAGPADSVLVDGQQTVVTAGRQSVIPSGIFTNTEGAGTGGNINVTAKAFTLQNGGKLSAETTGTSSGATGGSIIVTATDKVALTNHASITANTSGPGNAGNILVKADNIALRGGSTITASSTGSGNAGTVTIQGLQSPSKSLFIDGVNSGISTDTTNTGAGGDIGLTAGSVTLQNGGTISARTSGTKSSAIGGSITIHAKDQVTLTNGGSITASSVVDPKNPANTGIADAGNIKINAGRQLEMHNNSSITTTTQSSLANGGNIDIRAVDRVQLVNSTISTSVKGAEGSGGNIFIDPNVVILQGSNVTAEAVGGAGGNITLVTPVFLSDSASLVSASSQRGPSGTVNILSPLANLSSMVGQLVSKTSPAQVLLQNRCVALAGGEQSTFIVAGRDTLPSEPGGWLSSPLSMDHLNGHDMEHAAGPAARGIGRSRSPAMAAHKDETTVLSLRRLTPPEFLVRTFATGPTGCPS